MKIKKLFVLLFLSLFVTSGLYATNLFGKVVAQNRYNPGYYPLNEAVIELFIKKESQWSLVKKVITDSLGIFVFRDTAPGEYVIRVNGRLTYPVSVKDAKHQKLPPIVVQY